jgi:preprotein translocase subunit SecB
MPTALPLSPLQLKEHGFTTVRIQAVEGGSLKADPSLKPAIWFEQVAAKPNQWRLALTLQLGSQDPAKLFAYEAELKLQGLVEVADGFLQDRKEQLALVNGFSILYSAAREMLLNITARSVYGAVTLPTISFVSLVKEATQPKAPAQSPAAPVAA